MLGSNWKALIATQQVQVGVKRKADAMSGSGGAAAAASANAAATTEAVVTPCVAIDCEFVGIGADGTGDALARVSIVNFHSQVLYDKYVKPSEPVTDYRTAVSGIRPAHIHSKAAVSFKTAQREVADLIDGRIVVGHAIQNDLQVLLLSHPKHLVRDTAKYKGLCPDRPRSLKKLVAEVLQLDIQRGEHNSVEDARCTLALYKHHRVRWEKDLFDKQKKRAFQPPAAAEAAAATGTGGAAAAASATTTVVARSTFPKKGAQYDPHAARKDERRVRNVERNQRRKKMRTEQKHEKNNR